MSAQVDGSEVAEQRAVIDFTDVEAGGFDPVPRGRYIVQVEEAEIRDGNKAPYLNIQFNIIGPAEYEGRKLFDILSFSPKALFRLKRFYIAAGATKEQLAGQFEVDPDDLIDVVVGAAVKIEKSEEYGDRNRINTFFTAEVEAPAEENLAEITSSDQLTPAEEATARELQIVAEEAGSPIAEAPHASDR